MCERVLKCKVVIVSFVLDSLGFYNESPNTRELKTIEMHPFPALKAES